MKTVLIELQFCDSVQIDDEVVNKELTTRINHEALYWVENPFRWIDARLKCETKLEAKIERLREENERLRDCLKKTLNGCMIRRDMPAVLELLEKELSDE